MVIKVIEKNCQMIYCNTHHSFYETVPIKKDEYKVKKPCFLNFFLILFFRYFSLIIIFFLLFAWKTHKKNKIFKFKCNTPLPLYLEMKDCALRLIKSSTRQHFFCGGLLDRAGEKLHGVGQTFNRCLELRNRPCDVCNRVV